MNLRKNLSAQGRGAKRLFGQQPANPPPRKPGVVQPKMASQMRKQPVAPPVYRPQLAPQAVQPKMASVQPSRTGGSPAQPVAPPVYRPVPKKIVQPKMAAMAQPRQPPQSPPVYRPNQMPKVLQAKTVQPNQRPASKQPAFNAALPQGQQRAQSSSPALRPPSVIQRIVVPLYWKGAMGEEKDEDKQDIDRGTANLKKRNDSGNRTLSDTGTLNGIPDQEVIYVHGHGAPGKVGGYNAQELKTYLETNGLEKGYRGTIYVASCMSAVSTYMGLAKSVAGKLAELLRADGYNCSVKGMDDSIVIQNSGEIRVAKWWFTSVRDKAHKNLWWWMDKLDKYKKGDKTYSLFDISFNIDKYQRALQSAVDDYTEVTGALNTTTYTGEEWKPVLETLSMLANAGSG